MLGLPKKKSSNVRFPTMQSDKGNHYTLILPELPTHDHDNSSLSIFK